MGNATSNIKASVRGNPVRWLILGGALLVASIVVGTATIAEVFRERALQSAERELENTVLLLARHFDQQLEDFVIVQREIATRAQLAQLTSPDAFRSLMSTDDMHRILRAKSGGHPDVAGVNIFDADGRLINSSQHWPLPNVNITDRDYFATFKSGKAATPVLIQLVRGRFTGGWATVIAHRVSGPSGEFLGVVTRAITPASFEKFFASLALGDDAAISMYHRDGTLLARYPHVEAMIGLNFESSAIHRRILAKSDHGTTRLTSPIDGQDRLAAARMLSEFPISIIATTTVSAALTDWREQTRFLTAVAALSVLLIAGLLFLVVRKLSQQHRLEKERLDTAVNNIPQGLVVYDNTAHVTVCNERYIEMFGLSAEVVKPGCTMRDLIYHRKETGSFVGNVEEFCAATINDLALGKATRQITETPGGRVILIINQPLAAGGWVATTEDITEQKHAEERITHLAHYDPLTDLPNRVLFHERLKHELARLAPGEQLAVLYIDIDEFKNVNDTLGHLIGDELLKSVAASLSRCIEGDDFVARLGGDEFAVVQTAVKTDAEVVDLLTRIFDEIRTSYECLGHQVTTDASIGVALAPQHGADLHQILKNADMAMYAAKSAGRRTYRFFEPEMDAQAMARRLLELDLRQALSDGALEVYYQPCLGLQDNKITGCEALLRWRHPVRGMVSPAEFIPIAEETGLINQIGEWVLTTACAAAATWPQDIRLAVNVSPVQFKSGTLALKVIGALAASGLAASRLELEITEAVLIRDDETALAILHQLRAIGVRIALDDFGTGYSSLSYLQRFPFDKIKIDRCFVNDIEDSDGSSCIVQAVVTIATARQMTTTAEGVETKQQQQLLRMLGCSEMQGYLFSPAKPAAEIERLFFAHTKKSAAVA
ncbi:MAG: EAL domain-containing protein [Bradyrhizobium sp.]|uniref:bifunctional diguanylate cyclase/phosphodiesterase n=1 Tax=Bradyrhizobium sp. TaxID=376 RepID=UPI001C295182|nr:EAL domain-containing protein [Bradyrhizobium sp.]MBU6463427.1 EAL domain-containing protein [Pseudomonadota bacterium]MDE2067085.1 EAL domain-containing protein [Bradyrhizobium sp.]MDE2242332.1 EAL domain-containing protein [Bradyrhizobium sp.]